MDNYERILVVRQAFDDYRKVSKIKGVKINQDTEKLNDVITKEGFSSKDEFFLVNMSENFLEVDRCFRFRKIGNPDEVAICDNCEGRCNRTCYNHCDANGQGFVNQLNNLTPDSEGIAEQKAEILRLGFSLEEKYISTPTGVFMTHKMGYTFPNFCVGYAHKINEPRFDISWGMGQLIELGYAIYLEMEKSRI